MIKMTSADQVPQWRWGGRTTFLERKKSTAAAHEKINSVYTRAIPSRRGANQAWLKIFPTCSKKARHCQPKTSQLQKIKYSQRPTKRPIAPCSPAQVFCLELHAPRTKLKEPSREKWTKPKTGMHCIRKAKRQTNILERPSQRPGCIGNKQPSHYEKRPDFTPPRWEKSDWNEREIARRARKKFPAPQNNSPLLPSHRCTDPALAIFLRSTEIKFSTRRFSPGSSIPARKK